MKSKFTLPIFLFLSFCFLIALRDTLIDGIQINNRRDSLFLLFIFCSSASLYSYLIHVVRTKNFDYFTTFRTSSKQQRKTFGRLSIATLAVYGITVFGILAVSPGIVNFIEYGIMPATTLFLASKSIDEKTRPHEIIATIIGLIGVVFFTFIPDREGTLPHGWEWIFWILLFAVSAYLTSLCSLYQKQLVNNGLTPQEVLLYRFPLAAIICGIACIILKVDLQWDLLPKLLLISLFTVFLPLWLLCYAFMRESLRRFSIYLLFIPVFTVLIGALFGTDRVDIYENPLFLTGSAIILVGFLIFERILFKPKE